jgi:hypothetical protein
MRLDITELMLRESLAQNSGKYRRLFLKGGNTMGKI